ncbi:MAG TPA: hypothetical protein VKT29_15100 [Terriglobales bacterium]|nr:hypothetical protein [Terriglobales bacterium]
MRSYHCPPIVVLTVICAVFYVSPAVGQQYLCDQGSGKFAGRTTEGVVVTVGPEREGGLAKRDCDASINWGKEQLVVAANAATVDLDMMGVTLEKMGPVAAFQVKSNPNSFMSYVIYSLRRPPHVLRRLSGASSFSAADTDLDGRVEIWTDDAAAVDGVDGLLASEFDFLPTSVLRFEHGRVLDVSAQFQPYYDHVIESLRAGLTAQELANFKTSGGQPSLQGTAEAQPLYRLRDTKIKILEIVWAYLYSGRQKEAWNVLREMWPSQDVPRIQQAITNARAHGMQSQIDGTAPERHKRKRHAMIFQGSGVALPRAIQMSVPSSNAPLQVVPDIDVTIELTIDCAGKVRSIESSGPKWVHGYLEEAAKGWKFIPAFKVGQSVASRLKMDVFLQR